MIQVEYEVAWVHRILTVALLSKCTQDNAGSFTAGSNCTVATAAHLLDLVDKFTIKILLASMHMYTVDL
jgi:hypothetical protein